MRCLRTPAYFVPDRDIQVVGNTLAITEKGSIEICGKVQTTTYVYLSLKYSAIQNIKLFPVSHRQEREERFAGRENEVRATVA
jgi:hypothetical protein